jgi:putative endonuclease
MILLNLTMQRGGCVYIMTNANKTTLYIGVTSDLISRVMQHKEGAYPTSFSARYSLHLLVYYEIFHTIEEAIAREKQLKAASRIYKEKLIRLINPEWNDLFGEVSKW